jgi:hypothetical protein
MLFWLNSTCHKISCFLVVPSVSGLGVFPHLSCVAIGISQKTRSFIIQDFLPSLSKESTNLQTKLLCLHLHNSIHKNNHQ